MKIIKTIGKRIALKPVSLKNKTEGGILLVANHENSQEAEVVGKSNGYYDQKGNLHQQDVKLGDIVLINKKAGVREKIDNEDYIFILEEEIMAKLS